jgi:DNA-binding transcriptional ArsR family regulator
MIRYDPARRVDLAPAAALFRSLADPRRLAIVHELARGERRVVDLTRALGLAQSTVSAHVARLAGCGLVDARLAGRQSFYRLTQPALFAVLASAEQLLTEAGNGVALCPVRPAEADVDEGATGFVEIAAARQVPA